MKPTTKILGLTMIALLLAVFIFASSQPTAASGAERVFVEFVPGQKAAVKNNIQLAGGIIHYEFDALNAVAATVPTAALNGLSRNPNVVLIEEDAPRYPATQTVPYGINSVQASQVWANGGPTGDRASRSASLTPV
jgi:serine protease